MCFHGFPCRCGSFPCLAPHHPSPHTTVSCRTLLCANFVMETVRISSPRGNIVSFSSFIWIIRHASFILWISFSCFFHAHCCCSIDPWVVVVITLHLILIIPGGTFLCANQVCPMDDSNTSSRGYCVVFVFSQTFGTCVPFVSFEFRFHGFFSATRLRRKDLCVCWVICPLQR